MSMLVQVLDDVEEKKSEPKEKQLSAKDRLMQIVRGNEKLVGMVTSEEFHWNYVPSQPQPAGRTVLMIGGSAHEKREHRPVDLRRSQRSRAESSAVQSEADTKQSENEKVIDEKVFDEKNLTKSSPKTWNNLAKINGSHQKDRHVSQRRPVSRGKSRESTGTLPRITARDC